MCPSSTINQDVLTASNNDLSSYLLPAFIDMNQTAELLQSQRRMADLHFALATIILYDHLITLDREVQYVWKKKWTTSKLLFFINRYLAGAVSIYNAQIGTPPKLQGFIVGLAATIIIWSMQGIMQLRVSAMYGHSWKIIMLLLFFFICEVVSMSTTAGILFSETYEDIANSGTVKAVIYSPILYGCWIATVIMEALILVLALYAGYLHTATTRQMGNARTPFLAFTVIRDSILFPFLAFISYTITTIGWKYFPGPYAFGDVVSSFSSLVACVSGPRIILNLREAFYLPFTNEYDQAVRENSVLDPMEFADGDTEDSADGSSISND